MVLKNGQTVSFYILYAAILLPVFGDLSVTKWERLEVGLIQSYGLFLVICTGCIQGVYVHFLYAGGRHLRVTG